VQGASEDLGGQLARLDLVTPGGDQAAQLFDARHASDLLTRSGDAAAFAAADLRGLGTTCERHTHFIGSSHLSLESATHIFRANAKNGAISRA